MTDTAATPETEAATAAPVAPAASAAAQKVAAKPAPKLASVPPAATAPAKPPVAKKRATPAKAAKPKSVSTKLKTIPAASPAVTAAKETPMNDTIKTVTEKAKTMFTDANDRTKAQMEKGAKAFEDMGAFHKGNIEAMVESSKIAAKGFEKMGQDAAAYAKSSYEGATAAMKSMSGVKSPTELFKLQSDYAKTSFDAWVAEASRSTEAMLKLAGEIAQPIQNRVAVAVEKVKVAA